MQRPAEPFAWATEPGKRLRPSATQMAAGFRRGFKPPARWFNHLFGVLGDWLAYLDNERAQMRATAQDTALEATLQAWTEGAFLPNGGLWDVAVDTQRGHVWGVGPIAPGQPDAIFFLRNESRISNITRMTPAPPAPLSVIAYSPTVDRVVAAGAGHQLWCRPGQLGGDWAVAEAGAAAGAPADSLGLRWDEGAQVFYLVQAPTVGQPQRLFQSPDGLNWTALKAITDPDITIRAVIRSGAATLAIGHRGQGAQRQGVIYRTLDPVGVDWTLGLTYPAQSTFVDAALGFDIDGAPMLVVIDQRAVAMMSKDDGDTWTTAVPLTLFTRGIAYAAGRWLVVGFEGSSARARLNLFAGKELWSLKLVASFESPAIPDNRTIPMERNGADGRLVLTTTERLLLSATSPFFREA